MILKHSQIWRHQKEASVSMAELFITIGNHRQPVLKYVGLIFRFGTLFSLGAFLKFKALIWIWCNLFMELMSKTCKIPNLPHLCPKQHKNTRLAFHVSTYLFSLSCCTNDLVFGIKCNFSMVLMSEILRFFSNLSIFFKNNTTLLHCFCQH